MLDTGRSPQPTFSHHPATGALPTLGFNDTHLPPAIWHNLLSIHFRFLYLDTFCQGVVCLQRGVGLEKPSLGCSFCFCQFCFFIFTLNIFFLRIFTGKHYLGAGGVQDQGVSGAGSKRAGARRQGDDSKVGAFLFQQWPV